MSPRGENYRSLTVLYRSLAILQPGDDTQFGYTDSCMESSRSQPVARRFRGTAGDWDALVAQWPQAGFMQSAAWGVFKRHFGWVPYRLVLPWAGTAPLMAQVLVRRMPGSDFTVGYVPRGPLLDYADEAALAAVIFAQDHLARRVRAISMTWELPVERDPTLAARLQRLGMRPAAPVQHGSTRVLDLTPGIDQLQSTWKPKWRSNTRLAVRHGLRVQPAANDAEFASWYALFRQTSARDHFTIRAPEYYHRFWQQGALAGSTTLLLAWSEEQLLAGILVHRFGSEATYLYGASAGEGRNMMPNHLLQWEAMQWAKAGGAVRYDLFGIAGTEAEDEPLAGVSRFKAGFGGRAVRYAGAWERVYHPFLHALIQRARVGGLG
jgi:peptidoglycan pentaglycine glycine transferase (the first glycine)